MRHRCLGWDDSSGGGGVPALRFDTPEGERLVQADGLVLALGGASWPQLGSDGAWETWLARPGVDLAPLRPANCGFEVASAAPAGSGWSEHFASRYAGQALKSVAFELPGTGGGVWRQMGECVVSGYGIEGSLVYAASARLRDAIDANGSVCLHIDLLPARSLSWVQAELARPRGARSLSTHLKSRLGLSGVKAGLLHERVDKAAMADPMQLAAAIKALPLQLIAARPIAEAISSAGGVRFESMDDTLMLRALPGVFCAGEMLDWEAPTGGYLLTASLASGRVAGAGALAWLQSH
jgi:uncharacterized flavoprotein (TIGR03862 family)